MHQDSLWSPTDLLLFAVPKLIHLLLWSLAQHWRLNSRLHEDLSRLLALSSIYIYIYLLLKVNMAVTFLILPLELLFWSRARAFFLSIEKQASLFLVPIQFWVPIFLVLFLFPEKLVHCIKGCCCWCLVEIRERKISRLDPFWCQRKLKKSISLSRKFEREIRCSLFLRILFFSC